MSLKTWMLGRMNRVFTRSDLPPRRPPRDTAAGASPLEPVLRWDVDRSGSAASLEHLGPYGALIAAVRAELEHFVTSDVRLHLAIAERDRYLLTSIHVEDTGNEDARELLVRFTREFAPEQVKHYLAKEIIARLPHASAIDLSQFAGLNAGRELTATNEEADAYADLMKELRSAEPASSKRPYEVSLIGRWSETDPRPKEAATAGRRGGTVTPLAGRAIAIDVEDAEGCRCVELSSVVPGRRYVVGKDPGCDVVVSGVYTSRRHCEIWLDKGAWWIADSGSTNGIRVEPSNMNGQERRSSQASAGADGAVLEVTPGARIVLSASAQGEPTQYPRLILRPLGAERAAARPIPPVRAVATPHTPIALARRPGTRWMLAVHMVSGERTVDLPQEPGPFRVGRSRTQALVVDWAHEGVSGHHIDIEEADDEGVRVRVHGDNGVTVAGAAYAAGTEFRWKVGETMILGQAGPHEPECSMTLSRRP